MTDINLVIKFCTLMEIIFCNYYLNLTNCLIVCHTSTFQGYVFFNQNITSVTKQGIDVHF